MLVDKTNFGKAQRGALLEADSQGNGLHANLLMCLFVFVVVVCVCVVVSYSSEAGLSRMWRTVTINTLIPATVRCKPFYLFRGFA